MTKPKIIEILAALTVAIALPWGNMASAEETLIFNYPDGFANVNGAIRTAWEATFTGSAINLTPRSTEHQAGGAWYTTKQNITSFTTDFTFLQTSPSSGTDIEGMTFCVQDSNASTNPGAYGDNATGDANMMGYGAYSFQTATKNSIAIKFDLSGANAQNQYPAGRIPNATGLYINGGPAGGLIPEIDINPTGINLHSNHVMAAHVVYDGSILTLVLRDTVTGNQLRQSWPIDIPAVVGGSTAYIGFTGGTLPPVPQKILTWSFSTGYAPRLSAPTFSVAPGSYPGAQTVSINAPSGGTIYYTTNGLPPTSASKQYTGPISVAASELVQAIAIEAGQTDSLVAAANYQIAATGSPIINFPSGFANAANLVSVNGSARFSGSSIQLTDGGQESSSAWYMAPVNVSKFTTNFTIQLTNPSANGMTFSIQNQPQTSIDKSILYVSGGPHALANNGVGLGYAGTTNGYGGQETGLLNSIAVKFDLYTGGGNTTGLYKNGANPTTPDVSMSSSGVSLHSGDPLNVTLKYDGATLSMTVKDPKTKASFSDSWTVNIPAVVGGNTAYVGFTGGTGGLMANQNVLAWTYATSASSEAAPTPAAPTNLRVQ